MLAHFDGIHHDSHFGFAAPSAPVPPVRSAAAEPLALARLGDILPLVLERYGYATAHEDRSTPERRRPETNRPGVARMRRRVG